MICSHCNGSGQEPGTNGTAPQVPRSIKVALLQCRTLGKVPRLNLPAFWTAEYLAAPDVVHDQQLYIAEAWLIANPTRAPKKDLARFVHNWMQNAQRRAAEDA
jgi:hypothetical protein